MTPVSIVSLNRIQLDLCNEQVVPFYSYFHKLKILLSLRNSDLYMCICLKEVSKSGEICSVSRKTDLGCKAFWRDSVFY